MLVRHLPDSPYDILVDLVNRSVTLTNKELAQLHLRSVVVGQAVVVDMPKLVQHPILPMLPWANKYGVLKG